HRVGGDGRGGARPGRRVEEDEVVVRAGQPDRPVQDPRPIDELGQQRVELRVAPAAGSRSMTSTSSPLLAEARPALAPDRPAWGVVDHDQSALGFSRHLGKADRLDLKGKGQGYELTTALLVHPGTGDPLAPLELRLRAANAVYSSRDPAPGPKATWLDELLP